MGYKRKYSDVGRQSSKSLHEQTGQPYFTGRNPTRKERQRMPMRFRGPADQWPVYAILGARIWYGKQQFLVDWEADPQGNLFAPTWVSSRG
jgi:hypothetical protein